MTTLAMELREQGRALKALTGVVKRQGKVMSEHVDSCGELQIITAQKLDAISVTMEALTKRFEPIDDIGRVAGVLVKHGRKALWAIVIAAVGAYTTVLVQAHFNHEDTKATAVVAATAATQAVQAQATILKKLDTVAPAGN